MSDSNKSEGKSVLPPTVPIPNVNVPDPTMGGEPEAKDPRESTTGHEAFEKAKAETEGRK